MRGNYPQAKTEVRPLADESIHPTSAAVINPEPQVTVPSTPITPIIPLPTRTHNDTRLGVMSYAHVNSDAPVDPSGYTRTSLSPDNTNDGQSNKHRRNYQACEGCRQRKVKCDLGPVDAPHPPPCARCRRENRKCDFADTRKKRKSQSPDPEQFDAGHNEKRLRTVSNSQKSSPAAQPGSTGFAGGWSPERPSPSLYPSQHPPSSTPPLGVAPRFPNRMHSFPRPEPPRSVSQIAMPVVTKKDAQSELKSQAAESFINDPIATSERSLTLLAETANSMNRQDDFSAHPQTKRKSKSVISSIPHVNRDGSALDAEQLGEYRKAVSMWNKVTFVHSRFFSAEEGIAYVDYFYDKLQPMSPVVVPDYRDVSKHSELWTSEPILALTMLTIASRYKELTGVSATSRQYTIHDHLWKALTNRVQRLLWGQEQFGGGRLGKTREMANGQLTWTGSLRTLGTIEALLLLTDWQPRSLHFPPGNDEISLLAENLAVGDDLDDATDNHQLDFDAQETGPHTSWLEPAWRSDRMSWDLLSLALALSCELGVFDDPEKRLHRFDPDLGRKNRIRRLLTVYSAQTSGRIGIPSILRFDDSITDLSLEANRGDRVERMQGLWVHIAHIMDEANKQIFPSREYTIGLTHGNEYRERIQHFMPLLHKWMNHFTREREALDDVMVSILLMEYEYARLYINSIGLQHVVESWVRDGSSASNMARSVSENKQYIDEFTEAALHILEIVCGKMNDLGVLRDAPVRTFLRTLSAMMFTLKVCTSLLSSDVLLTDSTFTASQHGQP